MSARALEEGGQPTEGTSWGLWCVLSAALVRDSSHTGFLCDSDFRMLFNRSCPVAGVPIVQN